jgi:transcriptional regulator with XRE-family HTH domain
VLTLRVSLGLRIEELRTSLHLSRDELGELVEIDPRNLASYELYGVWPEPETLTDLSKGLRVEIHDLFDFTETRKRPALSLEERLANRGKRADRGVSRKREASPKIRQSGKP